MIAVGSVVTSATAFRVGVTWLELWAERTPPLLRLAAVAALGGSEGGTAAATFRDDLMAIGGESAERSYREMRRGVDDFNRFTQPENEQPGVRPHRPYRVKL
jgi:hypothetical protein